MIRKPLPKSDLSELSRCLLCYDAPCSSVCIHHLPISDILRSLYFNNPQSALDKVGAQSCADCAAPCEKSCVLSLASAPIQIKRLVCALVDTNVPSDEEPSTTHRPDISASICSVKLENPFLLSSSVVASNYQMCARAFEAGWAGAVFKTITLFEQHEASPRFSCVANHANTFYGFKNIEQLSTHSLSYNLDVFRQLKKDYPTKVIVASIMGRNEEEWTFLARECEQAGVDVIECNFSCPNMESSDLGVTIGQSEQLTERLTAAVRRGTQLPILAKLTPNITDMLPIALAAKRGGADGISAINTIHSITGVDLDSLTAQPCVQGKSIVGGYSGRAVKPIALRFISDLAKCEGLDKMHISGMGGIENWEDALEFITLGAENVQVTTAVMQYGYRIIEDLISGLEAYMKSHNITHIDSLIGAAVKSVVNHDAIERDTILLPKFIGTKCLGCGKCYIACSDGGHQAISFDTTIRRPHLIAKQCVGCHLCRLVCPEGAIDVADNRFDSLGV